MAGDSRKPGAVFKVDPLNDDRWRRLVATHPRSSVFHSRAWLAALHRTYGFRPLVYTTTSPGPELDNGVVLCDVRSWITGHRLVSLPFADHCAALVDGPAADLLRLAIDNHLRCDKLKYVEIRDAFPAVTEPGSTYCFHHIDLRPDLETLCGRLHKSSTQRKIARAEREHVRVDVGASEGLFESFWGLYLSTRRRHAAPPPPRAWFRNLMDCFGDALQFHVAFHGSRPAAGICTLRHKDTLIYKYGGSDLSLSHLGGTQLLFWRAIQEAKQLGLRTFDLGRTDLDNPGLMTFKDRLGATRSALTYTRLYPLRAPSHQGKSASLVGRLASAVLPKLPVPIFTAAGRLLYRHMA